MLTIIQRTLGAPLHPLHSALLVCAVPLFLGALLSDLAYSSSYEIQWKNFASWLIAGALVFSGLAMLWAVIDLFRKGRLPDGVPLYVLLLLGAWILGFINALIHAKDAWASMPEALVLSLLVAALALAATWIGYYTPRGKPLP